VGSSPSLPDPTSTPVPFLPTLSLSYLNYGWGGGGHGRALGPGFVFLNKVGKAASVPMLCVAGVPALPVVL
jgi:hypothetical protein